MNRISLLPGVLVLVLAGTSALGCALDLRTGPEVVQDRHLQAWNAQLRRYHDQYWQQKDNRISRYETSALDQETWAFATNQIEKGYEIAGRWQALKAFIRHMRSSPGRGLTDSWFVRQVDELRLRARSVNQDLAALGATPWRTTGRADAEAIYKWRGWVNGYYHELNSLYRQAMGYFADLGHAYQQEAERQARASQALMALGVYLQSQQPYNPTTTCTTWRNTITCN